MGKKIVIIGGVSAGTKAASRARRRDPEADIVVIEKGEALSYAGCGTPYFIAGTIPDYKELMATPVGVLRDGAFFRNVKAVTVHNRTLAEAIDRNARVVRTVHLDTGDRREFPYDRLVIATGSQPIRPSIPGMELSGVHVLSTLDDARAIRAEIESGVRTIAIVGGGLIGMEVAESLTERGAAVTVVEQKDHVLPNVLDSEMALLVEKHLRQKKVSLLTSTSVLRFTGDDRGRVTRVLTDRGEVPAELVLVAAGVRPDVSLAREAGLAIGPLGGIVVDDTLRTSDPDIFAGGDCVENRRLLTGAPVYAPMGSTANKHGRVIGDNLTGGATRYPGVLGTVILKVFDFHVGGTGLSERAARAAGFDVVTALVAGPARGMRRNGSTRRPSPSPTASRSMTSRWRIFPMRPPSPTPSTTSSTWRRRSRTRSPAWPPPIPRSRSGRRSTGGTNSSCSTCARPASTGRSASTTPDSGSSPWGSSGSGPRSFLGTGRSSPTARRPCARTRPSGSSKDRGSVT